MPTASRPRPLPAGASIAAAGVLIASIALGGLTSFGQTVLPASIGSFANSASGWTLLTAVLVRAARRGPVPSAVLGAGSFIALTVGYALVSTARGSFDDTLPWSVIGLLVGPFIGVAAAWLHDHGIRLAVGAGLLAGVGIGDSVFGLTANAASTSPVYWTLAAAVSLALAVAAALRIRSGRLVAVETAVLLLVAALMNLVYRML